MSSLKYLTPAYYVQIILLHGFIGYIVYAIPAVGEILLHLILAIWLFIIILRRNRNNEALMAAAYISGAEVFFRMTNSLIFYETGKYSVILFLVIGMFYKGASSKTVAYWIYLLILFPGVIVASFTLDYDVEFRKAVAFNLSGPVCLGVSALYCYYKKITKIEFTYILLMLLLPIISNAIYLFFATPSLGEALMYGTNSNYATSGGFGPNQVSTVLGLGSFILATRLFLVKNRFINIIDLILLCLIAYRAIITFSRGGVLTAAICLISFLIFYYYNFSNKKEGKDIFRRLLLFCTLIIGVWIYSVTKSNNLITYRYTNRNAAGELEDDITTGRAELIETELEGFYYNPVIGIGVGKGKGLRSELTGFATASHNEVSRLLAEHGILGIVALCILIFVPIIFWTKFKNNYYFLAFVAFWFLTINHSAMRIALPGFVYGLALLYIVDEKKNPVHRKRLASQ